MNRASGPGLAWLVGAGLFLAACATAGEIQTPDPNAAGPLAEALTSPDAGGRPVAEPESTRVNRRATDFEAYVPPQLLPLDGIRPVYDPVFTASAEAPLQEEELVIGVQLNGQAKAYPISVLRYREIVNDELGGIPILVTW